MISLATNSKNEFVFPVKIDILAYIKMAKNDAGSNKTKHIDIKYHPVRYLVDEKKLQVSHCPTVEMAADILTKPLGKIFFEKFKQMMRLEFISS